MAEEDFKEGFIKFWNSAVYFIFDIVASIFREIWRHFNGSRKLLVDTWQGGEYFHETFVRHHSNLTKYTIFIECLWLMIKIRKYL
jgi:hypothetical protein